MDYFNASNRYRNRGQEFENKVFELLLKYCDSKEAVGLIKPTNNRCDIEAQNGIKKLDLSQGSLIEAKVISNPSNIRTIFNKHRTKLLDNNLVYIVDIDKALVEQYFSLVGLKNIRVISYKDLLSENIFEENREKPRIFSSILKKCLSYENLADFITYCIRVKIVSFLNIGRVISSTEIDGSRNAFEYFGSGITPFVYLDTMNGRRLLFIGNNQQINKNGLYSTVEDYDETIRIQLNEDSNDSILVKYMRNGEHKSFCISKINLDDFNSFLFMYNENVGTNFEEDIILYKYRTFQRTPNRRVVVPRIYRTNKEAINFINRNTYNSLTQGTLWFSNREQVNDPFDLDIREPETIRLFKTKIMALPGYETHQSEYAVLCVTRTKDNLLLWSHYGDSHKGVCSSYSKTNIIKEIDSDQNISLCLYGNIEYLSRRPSFRPLFSLLSYVDYSLFLELFNIRCLFSKYKDWSYEEEMRFAILPSKKGSFLGGYGGIKHLPVMNYYGNRLDYKRYGVYFRVNNLNPVNTFKLSDSEYELILDYKYV